MCNCKILILNHWINLSKARLDENPAFGIRNLLVPVVTLSAEASADRAFGFIL